jgi:hypothetical protein
MKDSGFNDWWATIVVGNSRLAGLEIGHTEPSIVSGSANTPRFSKQKFEYQRLHLMKAAFQPPVQLPMFCCNKQLKVPPTLNTKEITLHSVYNLFQSALTAKTLLSK